MPTDTLARWGGDEFVILCEQLPDELTAHRLARRLTEACNEPWDIQGHPVTVPISLGLAFTASAGTSAADLLRQADAAMYVDKQSAG